jgi:hypothetical protein
MIFLIIMCIVLYNTATCKIIGSRYLIFNGFPEVNWHKKLLKAIEPPPVILHAAVSSETENNLYYT